MITRHYASTEFITGLRAIAVLMVFMIHSGGGGLVNLFEYGERIANLGKYGVDIFFVISGFTIFYQIYEKGYKTKKFILVRLARISIPYFPLIIVIYLYILNGGGVNYWAIKLANSEVSFVNLLMHLCYLSFLDIRYANTIIGVEWTLAVEVFYYFLLGYAIVKYQKYINLKLLVILLVTALAISLVITFFTYNNEIYRLYALWYPFRYGYMFMFGGLAYLIRVILLNKYSENFLKKLSNISLLFLLFIFVWFLLGINIPKSSLLNEVFFTLFTFLLLISVNDKSLLAKIFLKNKLFMFIGSISFSFYLYHMLVLKAPFLRINLENEFIEFLYYLVLTIIISSLSYLLFERKIYSFVKKYINQEK